MIVFEVPMNSTIIEAEHALNLDLLRSKLPKTPRVTAIEVEPYKDHMGEESLRVLVVLGKETKDRQRAWTRLEPIDQVIREALNAAGVALFPYVRYFKRSELRRKAVA